MNYTQLVSEIEKELGRPEWTPKLPELIRRAEDLVWSVATGQWLEQSVSMSVVAGTATYTVEELALLLKPTRVLLDNETELQLAPLRLKEDISSSYTASGTPEFCFLDTINRQLSLAPTPDSDASLLLVGDFKDNYLDASSTDQNSRLLATCPELLKLQVLLQIPDNRFQLWQKQYTDTLKSLRTIWVRQRKTGYVRTQPRRWL